MKEQEKIEIIISKCLSKTQINEEEIELICRKSKSDLLLNYNIQIEEVNFIYKWVNLCKKNIVNENNRSLRSNSRNLDYGHQISDSGEGKMAKRAMLTMAKDLYTLYCALNDGDDLPQWCHYKLANSKKDLGDISDYITSKITKICLDRNISQSDLKLEMRNIFSNSYLNEGFFDLFKSQNRRSNVTFTNEIEGLSGSNLIIKFLLDLKYSERLFHNIVDKNLDKEFDFIEISKKIKYCKKNMSTYRAYVDYISYKGLELQDRYSPKSAKVKNKSLFDKIKSIFFESKDLNSINIVSFAELINEIRINNISLFNINTLNKELVKLYRQYCNTYRKISKDEFYSSFTMYIHTRIVPSYEKVFNTFNQSELSIRKVLDTEKTNNDRIKKSKPVVFKTNPEELDKYEPKNDRKIHRG
tara:strand:+ start:1816 stop:3057 length:1242 start_codon:yes stop_codon:yes gene_type:complete